MRKLLFSLILSCLSCMTMNAQEVYNSIYEKAKESFENPSSSGIIKELNRFKLDALDYMLLKMREQMPDSSALFLDKEAYALHDFIGLYAKSLLEVRNQTKVFAVEIIKIFMDASYSNPLFDDKDLELAHTYYVDKNSMTRFSLDTDWRRAYLAASVQLKKWREKRLQ